MQAVCEGLHISERRACRALGQTRSSQRRRPALRDDEDALTAAVIGLARSFGRYGYKRITGLLQMAGWNVNAKRVRRIWRSEGLKVPKRQPKRGRLWLNDGSCIRLRPERKNHVWAYDFVAEKTDDGRTLKLLTVVDEYTRECLAIRVERRMTSHDVLWALADLFLEYGVPEHIRSDNGPEFVATAVRAWLAELGVTTLFIEPGSPWENGYVESFNGKLCDELLDGRDLLHAQRGADPRDQLAAALQRPASAQLARQQTAGARDDRLPGLLAGRLRSSDFYDGGDSGTSIRSGPTNGVRSGA